MIKIIRIIFYFLTSSLLFSISYAQTANIGIADYGNYTNSNLIFIANNVDVVVSGTRTIDIAGLKIINPDIEVLGYWGALFRYEGDTLGLTENMYFHDPVTLNRIQKNAPETIFDGMWLMNPNSTAWKQYSIDEINNTMTAGFDGIHMDEVIGNLTNSIWSFQGYTAAPAWYDTTAWNNAVKDYVDTIKTVISPNLVIFNGLNELPEFLEANYLSVCDGTIMEGFIYNTLWGGSPPTEAEWVARMNAYLSVAENKIIACVAQGSKNDVDGRMFSFASYLLGINDNRLFYYNFADNYDTLSYFPEWRIELGSPLNTFSTVSRYFNAVDNIYERNFTNGKVLVNPSETNSYTVSLIGIMYNAVPTGGLIDELGGTGTISYPSVSSVTLGPQQGVVLLNNPVVGIEQNNNQTSNQFSLSQNYPNPFNPTTTIRYGIPHSSQVELSIYDLLSRKVTTLIDKQQPAGGHTVQWNGMSDKGKFMSSGVYIMYLEVEAFVDVKKILLMK